MIPITMALLYRIQCEEKILVEEFGSEYEVYKANTKAIFPGII
jgi:protein-S-isoprenylcysteine O-methyltransferase Ste14